jgi:hypothetical protein
MDNIRRSFYDNILKSKKYINLLSLINDRDKNLECCNVYVKLLKKLNNKIVLLKQYGGTHLDIQDIESVISMLENSINQADHDNKQKIEKIGRLTDKSKKLKRQLDDEKKKVLKTPDIMKLVDSRSQDRINEIKQQHGVKITEYKDEIIKLTDELEKLKKVTPYDEDTKANIDKLNIAITKLADEFNILDKP